MSTRYFCDRCHQEKAVAPLKLIGVKRPGEGSEMTLRMIDACAACVEDVIGAFTPLQVVRSREKT